MNNVFCIIFTIFKIFYTKKADMYGFPKGNNQGLCLKFYVVKPKLCFAQPCIVSFTPLPDLFFQTLFLLVGATGDGKQS